MVEVGFYLPETTKNGVRYSEKLADHKKALMRSSDRKGVVSSSSRHPDHEDWAGLPEHACPFFDEKD